MPDRCSSQRLSPQGPADVLRQVRARVGEIDFSTACDVVQDVFLGVWRSLHRLGAEKHEVDEVLSASTVSEVEQLPMWRRIGIDRPQAWMADVCNKKSIDVIRRLGRSRLRADGNPVELCAPSTENEFAVEIVDMLQGLLAPRHWHVLYLRFVQGFSVREIAAQLRKDIEAVKKMVSRARAAARAILERAERREGGSSSASPELAC